MKRRTISIMAAAVEGGEGTRQKGRRDCLGGDRSKRIACAALVWLYCANAGLHAQNTIVVNEANPQSTSINGGFSGNLWVTVKDSSGNYLNNAAVTFSAPGSGPSAVFSNGTATITALTIGPQGTVDVQATANSIPGSYQVKATVAGAAAPAIFRLSNVNTNPAPPTPCAVTSTGDDDGAGTLRYQVASCGLNGTIAFTTLPNPSTITLSGPDIQMRQGLTIDGGMGGISISGNNASRIFFVNFWCTAT